MPSEKALLIWEESLEGIHALVDFRRNIRSFKKEPGTSLLEAFAESFSLANEESQPPSGLKRFKPQLKDMKRRRNIGVFSTAVCLETIAEYARYYKTRSQMINSDKEDPYIRLILQGLVGGIPDIHPQYLQRISTLSHLGRYWVLDRTPFSDECSWEIAEVPLPEGDKRALDKVLLDSVLEYSNRLYQSPFQLHPYESYKFLIFFELWKVQITSAFVDIAKDSERLDLYRSKIENGEFAKLLDDLLRKDRRDSTADDTVHHSESPNVERELCQETLSDQASKRVEPDLDPRSWLREFRSQLTRFFEFDIYNNAKYELYRQISLHHSGDLALYDVKRLIYSLLNVYTAGRFSNNLVRTKALDLIFEFQRKNASSLWPTGELVWIGVDISMEITSVECALDLMNCEPLFPFLDTYLDALKVIFDVHARTLQERGSKAVGWYPHDQRDKEVVSWFSALVLRFIKRFCNLVSLKIETLASHAFRHNAIQPDITWNQLFDSSAVKAKLSLMSTRSGIRSAILFGPPGTGKTSFARGLANKLEKDYLELTPADFFSVGEHAFVTRVNEIFDTLVHLENTLVFIDEVDDLLRARPTEPSGYDPSQFFVNVLLPRLQSIRDTASIYLVMASNHFKKLDEAILRLGRMDLIIPVAGLSPISRLTYLIGKHRSQLPREEEALVDILVTFLEQTEDISFKMLQLRLSELRDGSPLTEDFFKTFGTVPSLSGFIEEVAGLRERTRPRVSAGDFLGFQRMLHFDGTDCYLEHGEKRDVVKLFLYLNDGPQHAQQHISEITKTVAMICNKQYFGLASPLIDDVQTLAKECRDLQPAVKSLELLVSNLRIA